MNYIALALFILSPIGAAEESYPSLPSKVFSNYKVNINDRSAAAQAKAAKDFLASLDDKLKQQAQFDFEHNERQKWTNIPPKGHQGGVRTGDLNTEQMQKLMVLLGTVMSEQGYLKARNIPLADDRLLKNGKRHPGYGAEDYWLAIFGEPSATEPWAIQFDGHHLAYNITMRGDKMSLSPTFIGTRPKDFTLAGKVIRPIQGKADKAHTLIHLLTEPQQKIAIVSNKRRRIATAAGKDGVIPEISGIPVKQLDMESKAQLLSLIGEYVHDLPKAAADKRMQELKQELDQMHFSWSGPTDRKSAISYRIQGPTLIIEYACQNLGRDPLNHIHAMYRDPTNEYGTKLVRKNP